MPSLSLSARPLALLVASTVALGAAAAPAAAATGKTTTKATVTKAKGKAKTKAKAKNKAKAKPSKAKKAKADLTVKALHLDLTEDGTLSISANLLNQGKLFAKPSTVAIALSEDTKLSPGDEVLDELEFSRVGAGVKRSLGAEVDVPLDIDTSVDWNVLVCADSDGVIAEKNETNNCASQEITLDDLMADDSVEEEDTSDDEDVADEPWGDDGSDETDSAGDDL